MTKNPVLNALSAFAYIFCVALLMNWASRYLPKKDSLLSPVAAVSLFTMSAAVMGYIFCYQPLLFLFDKKKKEAVTLFLQTLGSFAVLTLLSFGLLFFGVFR